MPSEVVLTRRRAPRKEARQRLPIAGRIALPNCRASASARARVRLTRWIGAKPRIVKRIRTARAAPPAPSTIAAPGVRSKPGASWSRLARNPEPVGVGAEEPRPLEPERVQRPDGARRGLHAGDRGKGGLLVRHGDVSPDIAAFCEAGEEGGGLVRLDRLHDIVAGDAELAEPEPMDDRRPRMLDRPTDDAGDGDGHDSVSASQLSLALGTRLRHAVPRRELCNAHHAFRRGV